MIGKGSCGMSRGLRGGEPHCLCLRKQGEAHPCFLRDCFRREIKSIHMGLGHWLASGGQIVWKALQIFDNGPLVFCKPNFPGNICPLLVAGKAAINASQVSCSAYYSSQLVNLHYWRTVHIVLIIGWSDETWKRWLIELVSHLSAIQDIQTHGCICLPYILCVPLQANVRILESQGDTERYSTWHLVI